MGNKSILQSIGLDGTLIAILHLSTQMMAALISDSIVDCSGIAYNGNGIGRQ